MTPEQEKIVRRYAAEFVATNTVFADALRALLAEWEERSRVWAELSALVGCTSPSGDAELEQVRYLQQLVEERGQEIDKLRGIVAESDKAERGLYEVIAERGREIERSHKAVLALTGEIERLSEQLRLCDVPDGWETWRRNAEAEIERLKSEVEQETRHSDIAEASAFDAEARLAQVVEALRWLTNLACDVGKAGGTPEYGEIEDAIQQAKVALAAAQPKEER